MRRARLHEYVTELVQNEWTDDDADVAEAVLDDEDAFGALCHRLNEAGDGDQDDINEVWQDVVGGLSDSDLDFIAEQAASPAAFLAAKVR